MNMMFSKFKEKPKRSKSESELAMAHVNDMLSKIRRRLDSDTNGQIIEHYLKELDNSIKIIYLDAVRLSK